jgi:hypothetical protein
MFILNSDFPATWEAESGESLSPGVQDQLGQQSENLTKNKKQVL